VALLVLGVDDNLVVFVVSDDNSVPFFDDVAGLLDDDTSC
jgi:hypothetical protein